MYIQSLSSCSLYLLSQIAFISDFVFLPYIWLRLGSILFSNLLYVGGTFLDASIYNFTQWGRVCVRAEIAH